MTAVPIALSLASINPAPASPVPAPPQLTMCRQYSLHTTDGDEYHSFQFISAVQPPSNRRRPTTSHLKNSSRFNWDLNSRIPNDNNFYNLSPPIVTALVLIYMNFAAVMLSNSTLTRI